MARPPDLHPGATWSQPDSTEGRRHSGALRRQAAGSRERGSDDRQGTATAACPPRQAGARMPPSPHQQDQPHILRSRKNGKPFSPHPGSAELRCAILHRHWHAPDSGTASAATARAWTRTGRREHPPSAPGWRSPRPQVARWRSPADRMPAFAFAIACWLADARLAITAPRWRAQRPASTAVATHPQHAGPDRHGHVHAAHAPADLATHPAHRYRRRDQSAHECTYLHSPARICRKRPILIFRLTLH
jgi:hypothetical protein